MGRSTFGSESKLELPGQGRGSYLDLSTYESIGNPNGSRAALDHLRIPILGEALAA